MQAAPMPQNRFPCVGAAFFNVSALHNEAYFFRFNHYFCR
mgnify:FL=1